MFRSLFTDLAMLESWRRQKLTPEERAAEDRRERLRIIRDTIVVALLLTLSVSLTLLPWLIGLWSMASYLLGR